MAYERAASLGDLWKGDMMAAIVRGQKVLLVRTEEDVFAYENRCAHLGTALSEGRLEGHVLTCATHHWQYDVTTGRGVNPVNTCLRRFPARVEDGSIFVDVDAPSSEGA